MNNRKSIMLAVLLALGFGLSSAAYFPEANARDRGRDRDRDRGRHHHEHHHHHHHRDKTQSISVDNGGRSFGRSDVTGEHNFDSQMESEIE